jgi:hypothetical protein
VRRIVFLGALALASCGGTSTTETKLPESTGQAWATSASAIADLPCAAGRREADRLRRLLIRAVNGHRVPAALQEPLTSNVNALASWPSCGAGRRRARELAAWLSENSG